MAENSEWDQNAVSSEKLSLSNNEAAVVNKRWHLWAILRLFHNNLLEEEIFRYRLHSITLFYSKLCYTINYSPKDSEEIFTYFINRT